MADKLFGNPRRKAGSSEAMLAKTLRAWNDTGHLAGAEWGSARAALRDAARAVDVARADMYDGEGSAYSFARTNELFRAALDHYKTPGEVNTHDGIDDLLASFSLGPLRHPAQR